MDHSAPFAGRDDASPEERLATAIRYTEQAQACADDPDQYDRAEELLKEALLLVPDEPAFRSNYTAFCTEVGGYFSEDSAFDEAIEWFERALTYAPDDPETWLDLGTAYANLDQPLPALKAWDQCLKCLKKRREIEQDCIESISANVMILAKALDTKLEAKEDKKQLKTAIVKLIAALKVQA